MSNLKDTDIDDMFRRASDKYPLRTDSADWDRMAAALENKGTIPPTDGVDAEEKRKKRRFFWLFLLLPLFGAGYYAWHHAGAGNAGTANPGVAANAGNPAATTTAGSNTTAGTTANPGTAANTQKSDNAVTTDGSGTQNTKPDNSPNLTPANARRQPGGENSSSSTAANANGRKANSTAAIGVDVTAANATSATGNHAGKNSRRKNSLRKSSGAQNDAAQNTIAQNGIAQDEIAQQGIAQTSDDRLFYDLQRAPISRDYRLTVDVTAPAAKKDSATKPKDKTKHFYAGLFGSPDLSTVKMQSVNGVGSTFGLILGYTFNGGRWAIETGAYVDRKKYYTDGEYFNTKEVRIPYNSYLTDVNGICYMWEIPLNVRYNFNPGAKTSWFATAGFSTYLMSHEKYSYGLEWPGSTSPYDSTWNLHNASQYPFSIINLSAGFEQRLGKIGNLRVEPYVRIPLTGLGTGKLPIMSAGINIGITHQLW